jgi:hypothetical protein
MKILIIDPSLNENSHRVAALKKAFPDAIVILGTEEDLSRYDNWDLVTVSSIRLEAVPEKVWVSVLNIHNIAESIAAKISHDVQQWQWAVGCSVFGTVVTVNITFYMIEFVEWLNTKYKGESR